MPRNVRWKGQTIYRPGAYTFTDMSGLTNLDLGAERAIGIIGEADAGKPQATTADPVYHVFTSAQQMIDTFQTGYLAEVSRFAFGPALDGQDEDGVPIGGCDRVYVIKTNQSAQAEYTIVDASANDALKIKDLIWGLKGNQTWLKIEASGTGIKITIGRENAPNTGSQDSSDSAGVFADPGVDEWIQLGITGAFTGVSCTVAFDGTTLAFVSSVGAEDLAITCTDKTLQEIVQEIVSFAPITTAAYSATVLRADRSEISSTYLDQFIATNIFAADVSFFGVSYDMVTWLNSNSVYVEAEWLGGYVPDTLTTAYLVGGTQGESTEASIRAALRQFKKVNCRFLASAFSDATYGAAGAIALTSINGWITDSLNSRNPIGGKSEVQGFGCASSTTKALLWAEMANYNNEWFAVVIDQVFRETPTGRIGWMGAHCTAVAAAAIMAGSPIGTPLTQKYIRAYDTRPVATDFDPDEDTDFAAAINAGVMVVEHDPGVGIRFAKGISTYKTGDNDGHIMLEVVESRLWLHRLLRRNVERPFIGHKGRGVRTANQYKGRVIDVLRVVSNPNDPDVLLVAGTDAQGNDVPPYRNIVVRLSGDQLYADGEVTFTQGTNWALNEFRATLPSALA